jgi:hypothetical protein
MHGNLNEAPSAGIEPQPILKLSAPGAKRTVSLNYVASQCLRGASQSAVSQWMSQIIACMDQSQPNPSTAWKHAGKRCQRPETIAIA